MGNKKPACTTNCAPACRTATKRRWNPPRAAADAKPVDWRPRAAVLAIWKTKAKVILGQTAGADQKPATLADTGRPEDVQSYGGIFLREDPGRRQQKCAACPRPGARAPPIRQRTNARCGSCARCTPTARHLTGTSGCHPFRHWLSGMQTAGDDGILAEQQPMFERAQQYPGRPHPGEVHRRRRLRARPRHCPGKPCATCESHGPDAQFWRASPRWTPMSAPALLCRRRPRIGAAAGHRCLVKRCWMPRQFVHPAGRAAGVSGKL